jgi:hypothetical protein
MLAVEQADGSVEVIRGENALEDAITGSFSASTSHFLFVGPDHTSRSDRKMAASRRSTALAFANELLCS